MLPIREEPTAWPLRAFNRLLRDRARALRRFALPLTRTRSPQTQGGAPIRLYVVITVDTEGAHMAQRSPGRSPGPTSDISLAQFRRGGDVWRAFRSGWRDRHRDAAGERPRLTWFVRFDRQIAAAGGRDLVYGALVEAAAGAVAAFGDEIAWHHHHVQWDDGAALWRFHADYEGDRDHEAALAAFVRTTGIFPAAFRSGMLMMPVGLHRWLDDYIPFDFSLLIAPPEGRRRVDESSGVDMDWTGAPNDWTWYHPDPTDPRSPGEGHRVLFPCTGNWLWIEQAVVRARSAPVVLTIFTHDFEPFIVRTTAFLRHLARIASGLGVPYRFATAGEAARHALDLPGTVPRLTVSFSGDGATIASDLELFGPVPFAALSRSDERARVTLQRAGPLRWEAHPLDASPLVVGAVSALGGAAAVVVRA